MSAPDMWLANLLAQEDAHHFALVQACKTKRGTLTQKRWNELHCAIAIRMRETEKHFRLQCARTPQLWDGCDAWFEVHQ